MNNQWFSKVAVWMVIALVLFTVFKQFDRGVAQGNQIAYSDFLEEVKARRIRQVTLQEGAAGGTEILAITTDDKRLPKVLQNTSGFVYYVSITGITGAAAAQATDVAPEVARIKRSTDLPVIVGFGINTPEAAKTIASVADGCVVGSAIVKDIGEGKPVAEVLAKVKALAAGAHSA